LIDDGRFGVCCIFLVSSSGSTINQNCTYLRNPGFPAAYSTTGSLTYTVTKSSAGEVYLDLLIGQLIEIDVSIVI